MSVKNRYFIKIFNYLLYFLIFIYCSSCAEIDYSQVLVTKVIDGDTFIIQTGQKVRLIGLDAPELYESKKLHLDSQRSGESTEYIKLKGMKSFEFTNNLIANKIIKLEFDEEKVDKYGRLLAYAWLKDGTFVNAKIIEEGFARPIKKIPNIKYYDLFLNLYKKAKQDKKGLWKYKQGG